jgi:tetratricopeptide (TPR) repeat protein
MLKGLLIALSLIFFLIITSKANPQTVIAVVPTIQPKINQDTLISILQQNDYVLRQNRLIRFVKNYIKASLPDKITAVQDTFNRVFERNDLPAKEALSSFMKSIAFNTQHDLKNAELYMTKAIQQAMNKNEPYLLFQFYSHQGFIQTDQGNFIGAIYNYSLATKEIAKLKDKIKDNRPQASLNINISDLYYKTGFYAESINYLDKALALITDDEVYKAQILSAIYYNKSENYFRMKNMDSLQAYHQKLNDPKNKNYKIFTYRGRTAYYINLLKHNYATAIEQIKTLKKDTNYVASDLEDQHLADAYFLSGKLDSARYIIDKLLAVNTEIDHPEINSHLYETLAWIAEKEGDFKTSSQNFNLALKQSQENTIRLTQVGNISSQIKIDEAEDSYIQRTEIYKRERLWLIFTVVVAGLIIATIALIYRNVKQKRHYEKLLFAAKKEELAFINSHEVRKHLTNILGIIDILKHSDNKEQEYAQVEAYLLHSAGQLDKAIKSIADKLDEEEITR